MCLPSIILFTCPAISFYRKMDLVLAVESSVFPLENFFDFQLYLFLLETSDILSCPIFRTDSIILLVCAVFFSPIMLLRRPVWRCSRKWTSHSARIGVIHNVIISFPPFLFSFLIFYFISSMFLSFIPFLPLIPPLPSLSSSFFLSFLIFTLLRLCDQTDPRFLIPLPPSLGAGITDIHSYSQFMPWLHAC